MGVLRVGSSGPSPVGRLVVTDVWMETPDVLAFTAKDTPLTYGNIYDTGSPTGQTYDVWTLQANPAASGAMQYAEPIGATKQYLKFSDQPSTHFIDRIALRNPASYSISGGLSISAIYFGQEANNQGISWSNPAIQKFHVTQTITIYMQLASAPTPGATYNVTVPNISGFSFTADDKIIRAGGIRVSVGGYKSNDSKKTAYLCSRIPNRANHGSVDFGVEYGITSFNILDSGKNVVFTGSAVKRIDVADRDKVAVFTGFIDDGTGGGSPSGVAGNKLTVTSFTDGFIFANTTGILVSSHASLTAGTVTVSSFVSGTNGGAGVYIVSASLLVPSGSMWMADGYPIGIDVADLAVSAVCTGYTRGNPSVLQFAGGHPFSVGDGVRFRGFPGTPSSNSFEGSPGTAHAWISTRISATTSTSITVPVNSTSYAVFASGIFDPTIGGVNNTVYKTFNTNRAGCTVYELDYSSFTPSDGMYYLQIPGFGISDPTPIAQTQWAINTSLHHKGLYNLRLGIALDGRAGYTRGTAGVDGTNGTQNYWSILPAWASTEIGTVSACPQKINSGAGAFLVAVSGNQPCGTTRQAVGSKPGHQDAGDEDDLAIDHAPFWSDLCWKLEALPNPLSRFTPFTVPLSSQVCDPTLFAGTDDAPPLWHEIAWYCESLRTMQNTDALNTTLFGSVPGGYGLGRVGSQIPANLEPINYYRGNDPSNGVPQSGPYSVGYFLYASDHLSALYIAQLFAKFSILSKALGYTLVASTYSTAAINLLNWCESIRNSTTVRDNYYQTYLGWYAAMVTQFGWTLTNYNSCMTSLAATYDNQKAQVFATFWRLTANWATYGTVADAVYFNLPNTQGGWDYMRMGPANAAYPDNANDPNYVVAHGTTYIATRWATVGTFVGLAKQYICSGNAFMTNATATLGGCQNDDRMTIALMGDVFNSNSPRTDNFIKALLTQYSFQYGANLKGRQFCTGQGPRPTVLIDHNDSIRLGQPSPTGITPFAFPSSGWATYGLGTFFNFNNSEGDVQWIAGNLTGTAAFQLSPMFGYAKMWEPWSQAMSGWEFSPQNNALIVVSEFKIETLLKMTSGVLWLHGYDGSHI